MFLKCFPLNLHSLQQMMSPKVKVLLLLLFVRSKASVYQTQYYRIHIKKLIQRVGMDHWFYCLHSSWHSVKHSEETWRVVPCIHGYGQEMAERLEGLGAELAGVLAVPHFNRGSSARGPQCTWRPAWSPRMWAWSETRAAGSHIDPRHATRRCRNISLPGRRPSHQSLQQRGLRADEERVREITEMVTFWQPGTVYMCFHTHFTWGGAKKRIPCLK